MGHNGDTPANSFTELIFQSSLDGIVAFDLECRYTHWNPAMEKLVGVPAPEVLGRVAFDVFPFLKEIGEDQFFRRALEGHSSISRQRPFHVPGKDREGFFEGHYAPVRDSRGQIIGGMGIIRDVSDRVQVEVNERFRAVAEQAPFPVQLYRVDGECIFANPAWERFWVSRREELIGYNVISDPNIDAHGIRDHVTRAFRGESVQLPDIYYDPSTIGKIGEPRWLRAHFFPIRGAAGDVLEIAEIAQDVSDSKALTETVEILQVLNTLGHSFSQELDLEKLVQSITDAATQVSKASFGAFFHNNVNEHGENYVLYNLSGVPREAFSKFPMPRNTQVFGPTFAGEGVVRSDDITKDPRYGKNAPHRGMPEGHLPVRSYLAVPVISRAGTVLGGLFFGHPEVGVFTEKEEELVKGLAAQAAVAIDNAQLFLKAQEAVRTRDSFLSIASHELRTPVTSMKMQTQMMKRSRGKRDFSIYSPERVDKMVDQTDRSLDRLAKLIDDMLDVSRIQVGKLNLVNERTSLASVVKDVVERFEPQIAAAQMTVELNFEWDGEGNWDRHRLDQVVTNLVTNAIRYAPGGPLKISVTSREGLAILEVEDRGIGISPENQARIFQRFERLISANEISGMGLGLFIAKEIVHAHGGEIRVESELKKGAKFVVELPLEARRA